MDVTKLNFLFVVYSDTGVEALLSLSMDKLSTLQGRIDKELCTRDPGDNSFRSSVKEHLNK
jgi:hypothetical protein